MFTASALKPAQSHLVSRGPARESQVREALGPGPPSLLLPYSPRNTQSLCPEAWDPLFPAHHIQVTSAPCSLDRFFQADEQTGGAGSRLRRQGCQLSSQAMCCSHRAPLGTPMSHLPGAASHAGDSSVFHRIQDSLAAFGHHATT